MVCYMWDMFFSVLCVHYVSFCMQHLIKCKTFIEVELKVEVKSVKVRHEPTLLISMLCIE